MMKSTSLSDRGGGSDPPLMRMAIKDFQIRAQYIFWTDITAKQAKHMHVERTKDDLVCAFKLDLPAIAGISLIIIGTIVLNLFSKVAAH